MTRSQHPFNMLLSPIALFLVAVPALAAATTCTWGSFVVGGACKPCPPGTFQQRENRKSCDACPAGTFRPFPGGFYTTQCLKCAAGSTSGPGAARCKPCTPGTFSRPGWGRCLPRCKPGHGFAQSPSPRCAPCKPGTFNDGSFFECRRCPSGTAAAAFGAQRCTQCAPGTFRDMRFVTAVDVAGCFKCPVNTFSRAAGARQCALCPPGTVAQVGSTRCTSCPPNTFRYGLRFRKCKPCPPGTTSRGARPAGCKHPLRGCPFGTFLAMGGECRACSPGERLDVRTRTCVACPGGRFSRGGSTTACAQCGYGEEPANDLSIFEGSQCVCKAGWERDRSGRCRRCPPNFAFKEHPAGLVYNSNWRVFARWRLEPSCTLCRGAVPVDDGKRCGTCPLGSVLKRGGFSCTKCPPGTRPRPSMLIGKEVSESGFGAYSEECERLIDGCPRNSALVYRGAIGDCAPFRCPANTLRDFPFQGTCLSCRQNERVDRAKKICVSCPENSANPLDHIRETCTPCGRNGRADFERGCECRPGFVRSGNECESCTGNTIGTPQGCLPCAKGVLFTKPEGERECRECSGATVRRKHSFNRCMQCPHGFTPAYDVIGEKTDLCKPTGGYFPANFKGNRFMKMQ